MTARAAFWYVFGLAAIALLLYRLRPTRRANLRQPLSLSFTLMVFVAAAGTLAKQPPVANAIDTLLSPNTAWLVADCLFIAGMCAGTVWVDLLGQPALGARGWRLLLQARTVALALVVGWLVMAARLAAPIWASLERGTIDVGGSLILATARSGYFLFSIWVLATISLGLYRHRQQMSSRDIYVRLSFPFAGLALAPAASFIQLLAVWYGLAWPRFVPLVWPPLWVMVSAIQVVVMVLILGAFFPFIYHSIIWLDKQQLIRRLRRAYQTIQQTRPDLLKKSLEPKYLVDRQPDSQLAALVSQLEMFKHITGSVSGRALGAPAGAVMPVAAKQALRVETAQFLSALAGENAVTFAPIQGDAYTLAHWYAAIGRRLKP